MGSLKEKLQHLFFEMEKLRKLDRDILQKFLAINNGVDEIRWKVEEKEADFKRHLEQDEMEDVIESFMSNNECEWKTHVLPKMSDTTERPINLNFSPRMTPTSLGLFNDADASQHVSNSSKHNKISNENKYVDHQPQSKAFTNPTYVHYNAEEYLNQASKSYGKTTNEVKTMNQLSFHEFKSHQPTKEGSNDTLITGWHRAQNTGERYQTSTTRAAAVNQNSANLPSCIWKKVEQSKPKNVSRKSISSFRLLTDENSRIGKLNRWDDKASHEDKNRFQRQREYQNLMELSLVRVVDRSLPVSFPQVRSKYKLQELDTDKSLCGITPTESNFHSVEHQKKHEKVVWNGLPQQTTLESNSLGKKTSFRNHKSGNMRNYKKSENTIMPENNVVALSYKRTSNASSLQPQDDVTYL
ncbi:uncharacterized protein LOC143460350 isoform X2 [Clavelina lepadiformis]